MTVAVVLAVASLALGVMYTSVGLAGALDVRRRWTREGADVAGLAWAAMALTYGPQHLDHGIHLLAHGRRGGALELVAVLVALPASVIWFLLRLEAVRGGRGDRTVTRVPGWLRLLPGLGGICAVLVLAGLVVVLEGASTFPTSAPPDLLLVGVYATVGWRLLRSHLASRAATGAWSLSDVAQIGVVGSWALMHAVWTASMLSGRFAVDRPGFVLSWLAVLAAFSVLWVLRPAIGASTDPVHV